MTPDLSFASHIHDFVSRAKLRSALIFRSFLTRNTVNLKRAFITYVRPLLEYSSPVWSPSHINAINEIENVQRSFTKDSLVLVLSLIPNYWAYLTCQHWQTEDWLLIWLFVIIIVHGFSWMNTYSFFTPFIVAWSSVPFPGPTFKIKFEKILFCPPSSSGFEFIADIHCCSIQHACF